MKKLALCLLLSCSVVVSVHAEDGAVKRCVPIGKWASSSGKQLNTQEVIKSLSKKSVVLIGEDHDNPEHHRMQLYTMAELYARNPNMILGFEAFPRSVQKVLDKWVAGELTEDEFFKQTRWDEVWHFNKSYYLPMFEFARMNKIPMLALNVEQKLVMQVSMKGWDNVDKKMKEGISKPAPASKDYQEVLAEVYAQHMPKHSHDAASGKSADASDKELQEILKKPSFIKFVQGQLVWDRAMGQAIAGALDKNKNALVVGIMGAGHVMGGYGVVHQLRDLKVSSSSIKTLMPWGGLMGCDQLKDGAFDYAFGVKFVAPSEVAEIDHPRLGVYLENMDGVLITKIVPGSVADHLGIKVGDKIIQMAGRPVKKVMDVVTSVEVTAFGTWLPLQVERDGKKIDMVAKFAPKPNK